MRYLLTFILVLTLSAGVSAQARFTSGPEPIAQLRFYPNPATTQVTFDFNRSFDKGYTLQIYNFLGRKMYEATNVGQRTVLNLSDFNRGVYIYQLWDRNGKMAESGKFQVSK